MSPFVFPRLKHIWASHCESVTIKSLRKYGKWIELQTLALMHSTVIFIEGFFHFFTWAVIPSIPSPVENHLHGQGLLLLAFDKQLWRTATQLRSPREMRFFSSRPRAMSSSLGRLFSSETAAVWRSFSQSSCQAKQKKIDIDITCITWDTVWTHRLIYDATPQCQ